MNLMKFGTSIKVAAFSAALAISGAAAHADTVYVSYLGAGVQAPTVATFTTFDGIATGGYTTNFGTATITGVYSGNYVVGGAAYTAASLPAPAGYTYGAAGGSGDYIYVFGNQSTYSLDITNTANVSGVNYFGFWLSALDSGNKVELLRGGTVIFTFTPNELIAALGACPNGANPYCGNPNNGRDDGELFAYVQFYDATGYFDQVIYTETKGGAGYESDNHSVAVLDRAPGGTYVGPSPVPEPSSLALLGTGVLGVSGAIRRRMKK